MLRSTFSSTLAGWSPAYAAALALVVIQVGIGIVYKIAQKGGRLVIRAGADGVSGRLTSAQLHFLDIVLHYHIRVPQMCTFNIPVSPRMPETACCRGFYISGGSGHAGANITGREG